MTDFDVLMQMGFSREHIKHALSATQGYSMDEAIDLLLDNKIDVERRGQDEAKRTELPTEVFHAKVSLQKTPLSDAAPKRSKRYTKTRSKRKVKRNNSRSILSDYNSDLPTIQEEEVPIEQHYSATELYQLPPTNSKGSSSSSTPNSKVHKTVRKCSDCGKPCLRKIQSEYHTFKTGHENFVEVIKPRKHKVQKQKALVKVATEKAKELSKEIMETSEYLKVLKSDAEPKSTPAAPGKNYTFTRIQLRLLDGQTITETFLSTDELGALREFVNKHTKPKQAYDLITAFPRHTFTAEDYSKTFLELGLIPTSVIIMTKKH